MSVVARSLFAATALLLAAPAIASGTATPAPPAPPSVDFSGLPDTAVHRPINGDKTPHQVELRLISDKAFAVPGETVRVGLWLEQDEGWHTYWKFNPEVGQPTDITWTLPPGAEGGAYTYPVPQRFELEGIYSYGYDGQVLLFTDVTLPADLAPGTHTVSASAEWLTCEVQCIPGKGTVSLDLDVRAQGPSEPSAFAPLFDHFATQHPTPVDQVAADVTIEGSLDPATGVKPDGEWTATFTITPAEGRTLGDHNPLGEDTWPTLVPFNNKDALWVESYDFQKNDAGAMVVTMKGQAYQVDNPVPMEVGGLWQIDVDGKLVQTEFNIPMPWDPSATATAAADGTADAAPIGLSDGASPFVDDATCQTMIAGTAATAAAGPVETGILDVILLLGAAFLGGLILNVMPCVLPVITLKIYGLIEQKSDSTNERIVEGVAYTGGILASFLALAVAVIVAKVSFGQSVGWGFQMQSPIYVATLAAIVFGFGLSLFGVFEIPALGANQAAQAGYKEGPMGYFMTGVFATLLATPCSAPFLGSAMGFAFSQPPAVIALFFAMVGLGLASPFLLVAFVPAAYKVLPQPGAWMDTFKQLMGFTLVATAAWLVWVLSAQVSPDATLWFVFFLGVVGMGAWVFGHFGGLAATLTRQLVAAAVAGLLIFAGAWTMVDLTPDAREISDIEGDGRIPWQLFTEERMASVLSRYRDDQTDGLYAGRPLFMDFTAEWCLSCKVNEKTIIETDAIAEAMKAHNVVPLKGDWTNYEENITSWLGCYGRAGVPFYVVLPADPSQPAIPLGEAVTTGSIKAALAKAAGQEMAKAD